MDSEDKYIKDLFTVFESDKMPDHFIQNVNSKIETEKLARIKSAERREEIIQYALLSLSGIAIIVMFWFANKYYFKLSLTDIDLTTAGEALKATGISATNSLIDFSEMFLNGNSLIWLVIAVNSLLLLAFYYFIEKRFYRSQKHHS